MKGKNCTEQSWKLNKSVHLFRQFLLSKSILHVNKKKEEFSFLFFRVTPAGFKPATF